MCPPLRGRDIPAAARHQGSNGGDGAAAYPWQAGYGHHERAARLPGRGLSHRGESEAISANISADRARERADRPGSGLHDKSKAGV